MVKKFLSTILFLILVVVFFVVVIKLTAPKREKNMIYGASFNTEYASYLGLNPRIAFTKILDDWQFKYLRLTAQWNLIEKEKDKYDWSELDWMMSEAAKRNAKVVLVVGNKTPRWPECHFPSWVDAGSHQPDLLNFIKTVVMRYKDHPALEVWQVENEPFLQFGDCLAISRQELKEEVALVKQLDSLHSAMVTDSGELSFWWRSAKAADLFGTTMYRVVWSKLLGYWNYDWLMPPLAYTAKLWLNGRAVNTAYIMELQAEPWIPNEPLASASLAEQFKSMSLDRLKSNVNFAARTGMPRAYLWGAEWWLWLENRGNHDFADYIKELKKF